MKIYIGTDHAGLELKEKIKVYLEEKGHEVYDKGAFGYNGEDDYPDFIIPVAEEVAKDPDCMGIILGGSGQGEAMCSNRIHGVRACAYYGSSFEIPKLARAHNNANILSIGARFVSEFEAKDVLDIFLGTPFSGDERHVRRINKIDNLLEARN
ncbi:MAG: RpiB/LacA/LacB family sugar-phosphate isomerase [Candidatus Pacebacteria bacterium]|nr:RpiB/LacA/LacB family sugar-phosphate isomerase [Candidatus Paceibacterota bacterium]MBP9715666.1 RpiB/LacA/LacB family sugar-phosphate isomerase [Candidatus Paceibacterota bacterium]